MENERVELLQAPPVHREAQLCLQDLEVGMEVVALNPKS